MKILYLDTAKQISDQIRSEFLYPGSGIPKIKVEISEPKTGLTLTFEMYAGGKTPAELAATI